MTSGTAPWAPPGTTLVEHLGVGSVFQVARVRDKLDRELIAKRIAAHAHLPDFAQALERERMVLGAVTEPRGAEASRCLPELVASGTDQHGSFVVETIAPGIAARGFARDTPPFLAAPEWLATALEASRALADLHALSDREGALGIVHGDISPDNLFVLARRTVTFIDFSNATFRDAPKPAFARGRGTLPYVAPEIARNDQTPSQATDTYALAATLFFLAAGPPVHATTDASRLLEVGTRGLRLEKLEQRTDLPQRVRAALARALLFEPEGRLVSAAELAQEISRP